MLETQQGTPTNGQFMQLLTAIGKATATAVDEFPIKDLIDSANEDGKGLTERIKMVFESMLSAQKLTLQSPEFETWMTVSLGDGRSKDDLWAMLTNYNIPFSRDAEYFFDSIGAYGPRQGLEVVKATPTDFGFYSKPSFSSFMQAARMAGLFYCDPWFAPILRIRYVDQPKGEELFLAMGPLKHSRISYSAVLTLNHESDVISLGSYGFDSSSKIDLDTTWIFGKKRV